MKNVLASRWGIICVGGLIGILAALLQKIGNPGNHRFITGSMIATYLFKEYRPRVGSAPIVRFVLGAFAMIGALVFLGCPWRAVLRLATVTAKPSSGYWACRPASGSARNFLKTDIIWAAPRTPMRRSAGCCR